MKYLKTYEVRKYTKRTEKESDLSKLKLLYSEWEKIEDNTPWDFEYFWNKINNYWSNYQDRYSSSNTEAQIYLEYQQNYSEYLDRYDSILTNDEKWRKRNGFIRVSVNTGGASGGSCYDEADDEGAQPYDTGNTISYDDFDDFLKHILYGIFGRSLNPAGIGDVEKISKIIKDNPFKYRVKEGSYSENEYYGNYNDYSYIQISLWDLYKCISINDGF